MSKCVIPASQAAALHDALAGFYATIGGLHHDIVEQWEQGRATIVEGLVTYTRQDGLDVSVPVVTIYRTNGDDLIADYRIYGDLTPVFADH